jgi:hypothetical protein
VNWPAGTTKLSLTKSVQLINNCRIIGAAQKAGWLANKLQQQRDQKYRQPELEPEHVLEPELAVLYTSSYKKAKENRHIRLLI